MPATSELIWFEMWPYADVTQPSKAMTPKHELKDAAFVGLLSGWEFQDPPDVVDGKGKGCVE